jgi:hypothetical protein
LCFVAVPGVAAIRNFSYNCTYRQIEKKKFIAYTEWLKSQLTEI